MDKIEYDEFIEEIEEIYEKYSIVKGYLDVEKFDIIPAYHFKKLFCHWVIIGTCNEHDIDEALFNYDFDEIDKDGCYQFKCVILYDKGEFEDGRQISRGSYYVDYIKLEYDHSFLSRDRDKKLDDLFDVDFDIFNNPDI